MRHQRAFKALRFDDDFIVALFSFSLSAPAVSQPASLFERARALCTNVFPSLVRFLFALNSDKFATLQSFCLPLLDLFKMNRN
jgi:hypothetical protein